MDYDEAVARFADDMSNSCCDTDRKQATTWLAERIGDADKAERLRRDWMAKYWADMRALRG